MPNWTDYYIGIQQDYVEYHQQSEAELARGQQMWTEHQQMIDEQNMQVEELRKDKVKYPLFFLKEGIV